jgi:hypothetical protein
MEDVGGTVGGAEEVVVDSGGTELVTDTDDVETLDDAAEVVSEALELASDESETIDDVDDDEDDGDDDDGGDIPVGRLTDVDGRRD